MKNISKRYFVKIPKNIELIYSIAENILIIKGPLQRKKVQLQVQVYLIQQKNILKVTSLPFRTKPKNVIKNLKALQGSTSAFIRQLIVESSNVLYQKLKFVGVGYRAFNADNFEKKILMFKLGYSHFLYFKKAEKINIFCLKMTKLFIFGNSYQKVTQAAALIRSYKKPEPYKGKGILYTNEKIKLKEGKKT